MKITKINKKEAGFGPFKKCIFTLNGGLFKAKIPKFSIETVSECDYTYLQRSIFLVLKRFLNIFL